MTSWPQFEEDEIKAVTTVLQSGMVNYWTGTEVKKYEEDFTNYFKCKHAIAVANGSLALELALYGLNIGIGDEIIVTPRSFIASVSSAVLRGATPVFADVDENSQNLTANTIAAVLTNKTRAIILVHLAGWPCDMDSIMKLAREKNIYVIEDCAQSHGAMYKNTYCGTIGHVSAWSFCQDKIMTTGGEGGMVTTNNTKLFKRMWSYKDHGKDYDWIFNNKKIGTLYKTVGTNWRMTEMQAAIGRVVLKKLSEWINKRNKNAEIYNNIFKTVPEKLKITLPPNYIKHAYYKYYVFIREGWKKRDSVLQKIIESGLPCFTGSSPELYKEEAFQYLDTKELPVAKKLGETSLMLYVDHTLTPDLVKKYGDTLVSFL